MSANGTKTCQTLTANASPPRTRHPELSHPLITMATQAKCTSKGGVEPASGPFWPPRLPAAAGNSTQHAFIVKGQEEMEKGEESKTRLGESDEEVSTDAGLLSTQS